MIYPAVSRSYSSVAPPEFTVLYPGNSGLDLVIGGTKTAGIAFDPGKDARNIAKHGISLARAEEMDMSAALIHEDDRFDYGETRYVAFGEIDDALHCLVFTFRGSKVRAISLRTANKREIRRHGR